VLEKHCIIDSIGPCVADVNFVTSVVLMCVPKVVATGCVWYTCFLDPGVEIRFNFVAQRGKWACIVVVLSAEICVGWTVGVILAGCSMLSV
jgi:hypothetical protein